MSLPHFPLQGAALLNDPFSPENPLAKASEAIWAPHAAQVDDMMLRLKLAREGRAAGGRAELHPVVRPKAANGGANSAPSAHRPRQ